MRRLFAEKWVTLELLRGAMATTGQLYKIPSRLFLTILPVVMKVLASLLAVLLRPTTVPTVKMSLWSAIVVRAYLVNNYEYEVKV